MLFIDSKNEKIENIIEWENIFLNNPNKKHQWKIGYSAYELANFMINKNGENVLKIFLEKILEDELIFIKGHIEYVVKFDNFNHGREHDLGIWAKTKDQKNIFIGIEAKVNEPFYDTVEEMYIKCKVKELNGEKTNAPKRIEQLLKRHFKNINENHFKIRYQLLYSTVGTIDAKENKQFSDIPIFLIIVFKSEDYSIKKGKRNYDDFQYFLKQIKAQKIFKKKGQEMYKIQIEEKELHVGYLEI